MSTRSVFACILFLLVSGVCAAQNATEQDYTVDGYHVVFLSEYAGVNFKIEKIEEKDGHLDIYFASDQDTSDWLEANVKYMTAEASKGEETSVVSVALYWQYTCKDDGPQSVAIYPQHRCQQRPLQFSLFLHINVSLNAGYDLGIQQGETDLWLIEK